MTDEKLVKETLSWTNEVSEKYTGTIVEKMNDWRKEQITEAIERNDWDTAMSYVHQLREELEFLDKEYMRTE